MSQLHKVLVILSSLVVSFNQIIVPSIIENISLTL